MTSIQIIILAVFQGLTEFLPISSSAHLIMVPQISDWPDQGLAFDVAVHVGSLLAVMWYFRTEIARITHDWSVSCMHRKKYGDSQLGWAVIVGSIPLAVAGLVFHDLVDTVLRSPLVIAATTIGFGLLLWVADVWAKHRRDEHSLGWSDILFIGIAQALAIIPGTSRSGATMTAGLLMGLTRTAAARFSFLLSIPAILMAGGYKTLQLIQSENAVAWGELLAGVLLSALTAYLCIHWFLKLLDRIGMLPFVIYRLLLGAVLLYVFL